jgi:hypothetical protein
MITKFAGFALSKEAMKQVTGGCGYRLYYNGSLQHEGYYWSQSDAQAVANKWASKGSGYRGYWCCASC